MTSVSKTMDELRNLAKDPAKNVEAIRRIYERFLVREKLDPAQKAVFNHLEAEISKKLKSEPAKLAALYIFPLPAGYQKVEPSKIGTREQAIAALKVCVRNPNLYLSQIQAIFNKFGEQVRGTPESGKILDRLDSVTRMNFVDSEPPVAIPRTLSMRPTVVTQPPAAKKVEEEPGISGEAAGTQAQKGKARGVPTEQRLFPSQPRVPFSQLQAPPIPINQAYNRYMNSDAAAVAAASQADRDMFLGYFRTNKKGDPAAGDIWWQTHMSALGFTSADPPNINANPARDRRWMSLSQLTGIPVLDEQGMAIKANMQKIIDILNIFKSGDFLSGMRELYRANPISPLNTILAENIRTVCRQMVTNVPLSIITVGAMEGFHFKGGKIVLGVHAFLSHIVSQQYSVDLKPDYTLQIRPTGYTGKQLLTRAGATVQYKPSDYQTLQLDVSAEIPQGVSATGEAQFTGKPQGLIEASFTDASGKLRILKAPIYYGLRASYRAPSNAFGLAGALGVGVARLPGLGPVVLMVDTGGEIVQGDPTYSRPMSNVITRFGVGVTPSTRSGEAIPIKVYGLVGTSGEATLLGTRVDSLRGGGVETRLWGIRMGAEVSYRKASTIGGVPLTGGNNAVVMFNFDFTELLRNWIHKGR